MMQACSFAARAQQLPCDSRRQSKKHDVADVPQCAERRTYRDYDRPDRHR